MKYERLKKRQGGRSDREFGVEEIATPKTADVIAEQYGVTGTTIRNDAAYARAVDAIAETAGEEVKQERSKKKQGGTGANQFTQRSQNATSAKTAEAIAKQHGVDAATIYRDAAYARAIDTLSIKKSRATDPASLFADHLARTAGRGGETCG